MTRGVVVVGYGNAMRTDDGFGWHVADRLVDDPRLAGVEILQRHQLTPELAFDVSAAALVVLVDATSRLRPGAVAVERVEPSDAARSTWSHHVSPGVLVSLACELYGRSADVFVVSCGVQSAEIGDRLSSVAEAALPDAINAVAGLVALRRGTGSA